MKVKELVNNDTGSWKTDLVNFYFDPHVANQILSMPIFKNMGEDKCSWKFTSHGEYNVKTAYHYIMESLMDNSDLRVPGTWMKIWNMKIPQKFNDWYVFFGCNKVEEVWVEAGLWNFIQDKLEIADGFVDLFFQLLELLYHDSLHMFAMTMWCIWKRRNEKLWDDVETQPAISIG